MAARAERLALRAPAPRTESVINDLASHEVEAALSPSQVPVVPRAKPVRLSVDLAPQTYRQLLTYSADLASNLGRAKVPHVEVLRALIAELIANPEVRTHIDLRIKAQLQ